MIQRLLAIWSLVSLPYLDPAWTSGSSQFTYCWSLTWRNFEHYFTIMWDECNYAVVWAFFGIGMKTDLFQSCGHCWVFQICWHIECSTFTVLSFRIWTSSTGIPSLPLALFIMMLPKVHLTAHSRCLVLGEWLYHQDYLDCEDLFYMVLTANIIMVKTGSSFSLKIRCKTRMTSLVTSI